jgi:hypothetical protein
VDLMIANPSAAVLLIFRSDIYLEKNKPQSSAKAATYTTFYKSISIISGFFCVSLVQVGGNKPTISLQPETPKLKLFDF